MQYLPVGPPGKMAIKMERERERGKSITVANSVLCIVSQHKMILPKKFFLDINVFNLCFLRP